MLAGSAIVAFCTPHMGGHSSVGEETSKDKANSIVGPILACTGGALSTIWKCVEIDSRKGIVRYMGKRKTEFRTSLLCIVTEWKHFER